MGDPKDWMLPEQVFAFLRWHLSPNATVVEFGSGAGTQRLRDLCGPGSVVSFEHDLEYATHGGIIHAPIVDGWYDPEIVSRYMPNECDCIIIDGPPSRIGRAEVVNHLDLLPDAPFVVDDTHREPEYMIAARIARERGLEMSVHVLRSGRSFATLGWPW